MRSFVFVQDVLWMSQIWIDCLGKHIVGCMSSIAELAGLAARCDR